MAVRPLGTVVPKYRRKETYPTKILVPMTDGKVLHYRLDTETYNPTFASVMGLLRKMPYGDEKEPAP